MKDFLISVKENWEKFPKVEAVEWIIKAALYYCRLGEEMRVYSQNGEDGIIQRIFEKIGVTNKYFVEFGVEDGSECNSRWLKVKGWKGLWMDREKSGRQVKQEKVTKENIEKLFFKYKVPEEPDLISIDVDGNDYWLWKAMMRYKPRVVIIEFNALFGSEEKTITPYTERSRRNGGWVFGASLAALQDLAEKKGYTLIKCDSRGVNAFFIRKDLLSRYYFRSRK